MATRTGQRTPWYAGAREARGLRFVGHSDLAGNGDGCQLLRRGDRLYVGHMRRAGTTVLDVSDPERPLVTVQHPVAEGLHSHKVQIHGDLLLVNLEQAGLPPGVHYDPDGPTGGVELFDLAADPDDPPRLGTLPIDGKGVHRMWYDGGDHAYVSAVPSGFGERMLVVADVSDPTTPRVAGRWWEPGLDEAGGERPSWPAGQCVGLHHAIVQDGLAYGGMLDGGIVVLDVADPTAPTVRARWTFPGDWGGFAHTVLPLHGGRVLAVSQEQTVQGPRRPGRHVRLLGFDGERFEQLGVLPEPPSGPIPETVRYGPHNLHENRVGSRIEQDRLYVTYFGAGVRVYDISDPREPVEVACYVPEPPPGQAACQVNDVYVNDRFVYVSDRVGGGVWILEETA